MKYFEFQEKKFKFIHEYAKDKLFNEIDELTKQITKLEKSINNHNEELKLKEKKKIELESTLKEYKELIKQTV